MLLLLMAASLLAPEAIAAPSAASEISSDDVQARRSAAIELVDLIHPEQEMVRSNVRAWEAVARKGAAADPAMAKLESAYPGVIDASIKASGPVILEWSTDFVRKAKAIKVDMLADSMSVADMRDTYQFFSMPAGQRFLKRISGNTDVNLLADELKRVADKGSGQTLEDAVETTFQSTLKGAIEDTSSDDVVEIMKFEAKPAARKFAEVGGAADKAIMEVAANPSPEFITKQRQAAAKGAIEFIESRKAATAK